MSESSLSPQSATPSTPPPPTSEQEEIGYEDASTSEAIRELRSDWVFAATTQFLTMFQSVVHFPFDSTEAFEEALTQDTPNELLTNLHVKLLRILTFNRFVVPESWPHWFRKECEKKNQDWTQLFPEHLSYTELTPLQRVYILRRITDWQFDNPDRFRSFAKDDEAECVHWRVDPIGHDSQGYTYWLFDDNRLYQEFDPSTYTTHPVHKKYRYPSPFPLLPATNPASWRLVAHTPETWKQFPTKFAHSRHTLDKSLYQTLTTGVGARVLESLHDRALAAAEKARAEEAAKLAELARIQAEESAAALARKRASRLDITLTDSERIDMLLQSGINPFENEYTGRVTRNSRPTRNSSSTTTTSLDPPKDAAQLRQERASRRKRGDESPPIPASVLQESLESLDVDVEGDAPSIVEAVQRRAEEERDYEDDEKDLDDEFMSERRKRGRSGGVSGGEVTPAKRQRNDKKKGKSATKGKKKLAAAAGAGDVGESWLFSCSCGKRAKNWDDGLPMIACNRCSVWQHIGCINRELGIPEDPSTVSKWDTEDFICTACKKMESFVSSSALASNVDVKPVVPSIPQLALPTKAATQQPEQNNAQPIVYTQPVMAYAFAGAPPQIQTTQLPQSTNQHHSPVYMVPVMYPVAMIPQQSQPVVQTHQEHVQQPLSLRASVSPTKAAPSTNLAVAPIIPSSPRKTEQQRPRSVSPVTLTAPPAVANGSTNEEEEATKSTEDMGRVLLSLQGNSSD
ncbi:hypothetical protein HDU79_009289 [Rhizoclosmatium sp. JEL0117]|nr:hypothetical protein HDU79_009289 [Rhizoclosmatium sp. JEL0117]